MASGPPGSGCRASPGASPLSTSVCGAERSALCYASAPPATAVRADCVCSACTPVGAPIGLHQAARSHGAWESILYCAKSGDLPNILLSASSASDRSRLVVCTRHPPLPTSPPYSERFACRQFPVAPFVSLAVCRLFAVLLYLLVHHKSPGLPPVANIVYNSLNLLHFMLRCDVAPRDAAFFCRIPDAHAQPFRAP